MIKIKKYYFKLMRKLSKRSEDLYFLDSEKRIEKAYEEVEKYKEKYFYSQQKLRIEKQTTQQLYNSLEEYTNIMNEKEDECFKKYVEGNKDG